MGLPAGPRSPDLPNRPFVAGVAKRWIAPATSLWQRGAVALDRYQRQETGLLLAAFSTTLANSGFTSVCEA